MLREIAELGFEFAELSHGIRITLVPGILRAVAEGVIKVSSTHNFCPLPTGTLGAAPNLYEPSSLDAREIDQWLRHTKRSIDFAEQVAAQVVVCHLGRVRFGWFNPARKLRRHLQSHRPGEAAGDARQARRVASAVAKLRRRLPAHWAQVKASVRAILPHAASHGVRLGFENRDGFDELPFDADWSDFLDGWEPDAPLGYWHDTGHAAIKERMGLVQPDAQLERLSARTLGFHLHDVDADARDHQPFGAGSVSLERVSRFWRPEHYLTLELSPRATLDAVRDSKRQIEALRKI